jgi:predicted phage terminase large subunit-like protein
MTLDASLLDSLSPRQLQAARLLARRGELRIVPAGSALTDAGTAARESLAEFIRQGWGIVEPGTPLLWNWHIDAIAEHLEAVADGRIRRLLINIPPGHMKSLIVSVFWPAWMWVRRAAWRALFASYAKELATRDSVRCRDLVRSDWYRDTFKPAWRLATDQNVKSFFQNTEHGFRYSLGVGGQGTGWRGDAVVVDDPLNVNDQWSELARAEVIRWWDKTMSSRLNDQRTGARVIIMQRLHEEDLSGHILARKSTTGAYDHLCLPSEFDPERRSSTSIGWSDPRTEAGELLFAALFPKQVLLEAKEDLGSADYAGQHGQRPTPAEGLIFKAAWFASCYRTIPEFTEVFTTWDTALKAKEQNDETACFSSGIGADGNLYVLRVAHGHWETPDVAKFLVAQAEWLRRLYGERYRGDYVEDKVSGTTLIQYVRRSNPDLVLIPVAVEADKVSRARGVTPLCEAGRVILPDPSIYPEARFWIDDLLAQLLVFPAGKLDDITDVFVYACKRLLGTLGGRGMRKSKRGGYV